MVKILIKIGILFIVLVVMFLAFNLFIKKAMTEKIQDAENRIAQNTHIQTSLDDMLSHHKSWPAVLAAQKRDLEHIRAVLPEAPFREDIYLRILLDVFDKSSVYSSQLMIKPVRPPAGRADYWQFFTTDIGALAGYIEPFDNAFKYLQGSDKIKGEDIKRIDSLVLKPAHTDEDFELSLWYSFRFNQMMAVNMPEGVSLLPGLEMHRFETTVSGSYESIKHFLWSIKNMVPHTVIVNWHLSPGPGIGEGRTYSAALSLLTFVDTNKQPVFEHDPNDPFFEFAYKPLPDLPDISPLLVMLGFDKGI